MIIKYGKLKNSQIMISRLIPIQKPKIQLMHYLKS